jgi:hypothetical protein
MHEARSTSATQWPALVLAWLVVGVPTLWGVAQTVVKSLALFR